MAEFTINIDADASVIWANRLERFSKSGLPMAVRTALNSTAFDVKKRTMPAAAKEDFVNRSKNFFKANSRVDMAKGFNVNLMKSTVGFISNNLKGSSNFAVQDLEQQEHGGTIQGKSFIPLKEARVSKSMSKLVRPANRLSRIKNIVNTKDVKGTKNKSQRFIRAAFMAKKLYGNNAFVLNSYQGSRQTLSKIDQISSNMKTRKLQIVRTPVYSYKKGRHVAVKSKGFMKRASYEANMKMEEHFINAARKQLNRI